MTSALIMAVLAAAGCAQEGPEARATPPLDVAALYAAKTDADVARAAAAVQTALESHAPGDPLSWTNPQTGNAGIVTAGAVSVTDRGVFCRDYEERLQVGGREGVASHSACRGDDGVWRLLI